MKNFIEKIKQNIKSITYIEYLTAIIIFYAAGSLIINLMAVKTMGVYDIIDYQTHFGEAILPITTAGTCISWLVFAALDVITEVAGNKVANKTFWTVGIINLILTIVAALICFIPGNPWTESSYEGVFGGNWGITLSSLLAFLLGSYVNVVIMYVMKTRTQDKNSGFGFTLRVLVSTLVGQFIDNALFYILALAPGFGLGGFVNEAVRCSSWRNLWIIVGFTTAIELIVEVIFSPLFHKLSQALIRKRQLEQNSRTVEAK